MEGCWSTILTTFHAYSRVLPPVHNQLYIFSFSIQIVQFKKLLQIIRKKALYYRSSTQVTASSFEVQRERFQVVDKSSQRAKAFWPTVLGLSKKNHPQVEPLLATYTNRFHFSWLAREVPIWSTLVMQRSHILVEEIYLFG